MKTGLLRLLVRGYLPAAAAGILVAVSAHWLAGFLVFWLGGAVSVLALAACEVPRRAARPVAARFPGGSEDCEHVT